MRTINVYANGSPIHSRVIEHLLEHSTADENVIINYRGMQMPTSKAGIQFHCKNEEFLNGRPEVKRIFDRLDQVASNGSTVNLYVAHSNYLFCKIHSALELGTFNYIEDGIGTYAALIDAERGTDFFARAMGTDVTRSGSVSLPQFILNSLPEMVRRVALRKARKLWHLNRSLAVNLFVVALRNREIFFDWQAANYANIYLTISKFPRFRSAEVPLVIKPPVALPDARYMVLIPPRKIIGEFYFSKFIKAMCKLRAERKGINFDYKSHPSDTENADYRLITAEATLAGRLITIESNNETAIVAYEHGYKGLVCYDSSATLYARSFLASHGFECIDLCKDMTGRDAFGVSLTNELASF